MSATIVLAMAEVVAAAAAVYGNHSHRTLSLLPPMPPPRRHWRNALHVLSFVLRSIAGSHLEIRLDRCCCGRGGGGCGLGWVVGIERVAVEEWVVDFEIAHLWRIMMGGENDDDDIGMKTRDSAENSVDRDAQRKRCCL